MQGKYLITTDNWFYAPDGKQYKAAWGEVKVFNDDVVLGIKTNVRSSNWYAIVGDSDKEVMIAGCQIHYAVKCNEKPNKDQVNDYHVCDSGVTHYSRPSSIYIAE